jgi:hypothetical protein
MSEEEKAKTRLLRRTGNNLSSDDIRPIVVDYKKRKKKGKNGRQGKKYSPGLEDIQRLEGNAVKIANRATRALSKGIETYDEERKRSAKEKKDGAVEDFVHNSAKAASATLKEASDLPIDLAEAVNMKSYRKRMRTGLRRTSRILRTWRI